MIYNEDCLEGMKKIADGSVDAIICDPPFGTTDCVFDERLPIEPLWEQFLRVTKINAAIVLFSQMPFGAELIMSNRKMFRYEWVWSKSLGVGFLNAKKMPLRCHENILVFYRKKQRPTRLESDGRRYPRDVLLFAPIRDVHPQQKPVELLEYLIRTYTNEGEVVLDATMGSGSTGVAAINTGREFIGFETDKNFYDIAERRIAAAIVQREQSLF